MFITLAIVSHHALITLTCKKSVDIFSKSEIFGCFDTMGGSFKAQPLVCLNFMRDMLILSDYLNVMLLKY